MVTHLKGALIVLGLGLVAGCGKEAIPERPSPKPPAKPPAVGKQPQQQKEDKPKPPPFVGVRWVAGTKEELARLVAHIPQPIRKLYGEDSRCFDDLGGKAWAFEYAGGPVRCWLEIEETGQATFSKRYPEGKSDAPGAWEGRGEKGRIVLWVRRGVSDRVNKVLERVGRKPGDTSAVALGCTLTSDKGGANMAASFTNPLWFGWKGHTFDSRLLEEKPLPDGQPVTVLAVTATEVVKDGKPRHAKLTFRGQRLSGR